MSIHWGGRGAGHISRLSTSTTGVPSLVLDFLTTTSLDSRITFTRISNATLVDATGKITYAPANLMLQSQTIASSPWSGDTSGGSVPTATNNAGIAPDGTSTATRLQLNRGAGTFSRWQQVAGGSTGFYIASVYMRTTSGTGTANVGLRNDSTGVNCVVTGTWQRFSVINSPASSTPNIQILSFTAIPGTDVSADILVWGAQLEQITYQTLPSTYVATTASAYYGPRFDYDPVTLAPKGLLIEEQRTNSATYSEDFSNAAWSNSGLLAFGSGSTVNATAAPNGTTTADLITEDTSTASHRVFRQLLLAANTAGSFSFFVKRATGSRNVFVIVQIGGDLLYCRVNLSDGSVIQQGVSGTASGVVASVQSYANSFYRVSISGIVSTTGVNPFVQVYLNNTATADGSTPPSYTGNGTSGVFIWGAQFETGAFATSYIPTVAASIIRYSDNAVMTGTNFSSWYNQTEGTFVAGASAAAAPASAARVLEASAGTAARVVDLNVTTGPALQMYNGTASMNTSGAVTLNVPFKTAGAYKTANYGAVLNGAAVTTTTDALVNTANALQIGRFNTASNYLNGHISFITYYKTRLLNTQLQTLTR